MLTPNPNLYCVSKVSTPNLCLLVVVSICLSSIGSKLDWYRECSFLEQRTEDVWLFGSPRDPEEASSAVEQATNLFLNAEDRDIHVCSSFDNKIPIENLLDGSLHVASLSINIAQVRETRRPGARSCRRESCYERAFLGRRSHESTTALFLRRSCLRV
jgi:hypothetical protein